MKKNEIGNIILIKEKILLPEFRDDRNYEVVNTFWTYDIERFPFIHKAYRTKLIGGADYPTYVFYGDEIEK